ncbi:hypothetical protein IM697_04220 [Streptomyces ferrugineus]|uniref:DUF2637 domain-containing protein n=1 Tax=Streptomyces ferrugineus TaxID=1413221 RepID=A0A7M2SQ74_9ACTN|nr:hypothetical protein [Streptomyces ferrugineus]QOV37643.1 hypothetical protein IM697_04220 [Streptomyces ferrugineus]
MAVVLLGLLILLVLSGAFVASWPSLMYAAEAVHLSGWGAIGYSVVPDSAVVIALVTLLLLRHDLKARRLAFATLATFTAASLTLNEAHALGLYEGRPVWLLAVAGALPVVGILLASDLLVRAVAVLAPALEELDETEAQPVVETPAVEAAPAVMTAEEFEEHQAAILAELEAEKEAAAPHAERPSRTGRGHFV